MRQILQDSSEALTSLVINIKGNEEVLLQPGFKFKNLESIEINDYDEDGIKYYDEDFYDTKVTVVEAMLVKHASSLKNLTVKDLEKSITVPALPKLDSLSLVIVSEESGRNLLDETRDTITSLNIDRLILNVDSTTPITDADSTNEAFYEIQNLTHLKIESLDYKFILFNAEHLMSLTVNKSHDYPHGEFFQEINNVEWPHFPILRELAIVNTSDLMPILRNSNETIELLVLFCAYGDDEIGDWTMPNLTDLYVFYGSGVIMNKIFSANYKSLENLFLINSQIHTFDDGFRMERMKLVVLKSDPDFGLFKYSDHDRDVMAVMCPNADVVLFNDENEGEIKKKIKDRSKTRNYLIDITKSMEDEDW